MAVVLVATLVELVGPCVVLVDGTVVSMAVGGVMEGTAVVVATDAAGSAPVVRVGALGGGEVATVLDGGGLD